MKFAVNVVEELVLDEKVPAHILLLLKAYKFESKVIENGRYTACRKKKTKK